MPNVTWTDDKTGQRETRTFPYTDEGRQAAHEFAYRVGGTVADQAVEQRKPYKPMDPERRNAALRMADPTGLVETLIPGFEAVQAYLPALRQAGEAPVTDPTAGVAERLPPFEPPRPTSDIDRIRAVVNALIRQPASWDSATATVPTTPDVERRVTATPGGGPTAQAIREVDTPTGMVPWLRRRSQVLSPVLPTPSGGPPRQEDIRLLDTADQTNPVIALLETLAAALGPGTESLAISGELPATQSGTPGRPGVSRTGIVAPDAERLAEERRIATEPQWGQDHRGLNLRDVIRSWEVPGTPTSRSRQRRQGWAPGTRR